MKEIIIAFFLASIMTGCASYKTATEEEFGKADFGSAITPNQFDELAKANLINKLIDPLSLLYYGTALTELTKYYASDDQGVLHYGYIACYQYNAKNTLGGYAGKSKECAFLEKGKIVQIYTVGYPQPIWFPEVNTMNGRF